ncbi:hypothetical protein [Vibrio atypicus]|uniref:hypothetical protein n=1 Tax=Vibrio atypicus TaxID=558271 RepID=UPI0013568CB7|nr:hypothetical protein [Vibrio atypicus]
MNFIDCTSVGGGLWEYITIEFLGAFVLSFLVCFLLCRWTIRDISKSNVNRLTWTVVFTFPILCLFSSTVLELTVPLLPEEGECADLSVAMVKVLQKSMEVFFIGVILATISALINYKVTKDSRDTSVIPSPYSGALVKKKDVYKLAALCGLATMFGNGVLLFIVYLMSK